MCEKREKLKDDFYKLYCSFIESVQLIEQRLRYYYASIKAGKPDIFNEGWFNELGNMNRDTIGKLVFLIKNEEKKTGIKYLPDEMSRRLKKLRKARNFWVHECFINGSVNITKQNSQKSMDVKIAIEEKFAYDLNEDLFKVERAFSDKHCNKLISSL